MLTDTSLHYPRNPTRNQLGRGRRRREPGAQEVPGWPLPTALLAVMGVVGPNDAQQLHLGGVVNRHETLRADKLLHIDGSALRLGAPR